MKAVFVYVSKPTSYGGRLDGVRLMADILAESGCDRSMLKSVYMTGVGGGRKPSASDFEKGREAFLKSIGDEPVIIATMGAQATTSATKGAYSVTNVRGAPMPAPEIEDLPYPKGSIVYAMFDPMQVWQNPGIEDLFRKDVERLAKLVKGEPLGEPKVDNIVVSHPSEVMEFARALPDVWAGLPEDERFLVVDLEWHGRNWMDPDRYVRTVQVGYAPGMALTVELHRENVFFEDESKWPTKAAERKAAIEEALRNPVRVCKDMDGMWKALKGLLEDAGRPIVGHNVIADWQWLLSYGVDIRRNVVFDTMLAEHLINSDGPLRLDEVAMRRTQYGRYSAEVDTWVSKHKSCSKDGYGAVPSRLLRPYAGCDVDCPRMIMKEQMRILDEYGMLKPRGPNNEYPSLLDSVMLNELATDELERNGLMVDRQRLAELIDAYQAMKSQLLSEVTLMAMGLGMTAFNPNSQRQMRELLFGRLKLTPVKTTGGQNWADVIGNYEIDDEDAPSSSTDKATLELLQNEHPIVKKLLQFRRVDQVCKTWLRHPDENGEGGLESLIWEDGKLHPGFLPTTSTGRYRTRDPNSQNFPKRADSYLGEIFGEGNVPPSIRTIVVPPEGWILMEGDFKQAELFTLANISGDQNMLRLLTTPGLDLHDSTTVTSFGMRMVDESGKEVTEDDLVALATRIGADSDEFTHYMKAMTYVQIDGKVLTRSDFKAGPRINAKSLNFGIPYGRGAKACALMIKAETGTPTPLRELENQCERMIDAWKNVTFPTAWAYLEGCHRAVYDPGYVENPWGFRKTFHVRKGEVRRDFEREAGNLPIQSTVAQTVNIAADLIRRYRREHGMKFRLQNQIHDAIMLELPIEEREECEKMFNETMAAVKIPLGNGRYFQLGCDIDLYERWGKKYKTD